MIRGLAYLLLFLFIFSCKQGKKSLNSEEITSAEDFVSSFPELTLPFQLPDSALDKKLGDTALINAKLVGEFIPDTVFRKDFKNAKPKFYAIGRAVDKNEDNYLVVKAATPSRQVGYLLCFDREFRFKAGMPLVTSDPERNVQLEGSLDKRFTISKNRRKTARDGQVFYSRNVYVYNNVGTFTLILTESNEVAEEEEVYNPIDSLPTTFIWTGNYVKDEKNFVTVRDGSRPNRVAIFIHFEKNGGECVGELKGEAEMVQPAVARYAAAGDPCSLELKFDAKKVTVFETSGCGNHRGIRCFFNDSYPKKQVRQTRKTQVRPK